MLITNYRSIGCILLGLCLLVRPATGAEETKGLELLIAKTEKEDVFQFTMVNHGKTPTETFWSIYAPIGVKVLLPDGSVYTNSHGMLFRNSDAIPPGGKLSTTRTTNQLAVGDLLEGTYKLYFYYQKYRSNVVIFSMKGPDRKVPEKSAVAEDAINCYREIAKSAEAFDEMLSLAESPAELETRKALIALSIAQVAFINKAGIQFGEEAGRVKWRFVVINDEVAESFRKGTVEVSEHFDTATLLPKGATSPIHLQAGPLRRWILDLKTFEADREKIASSAETLKQITGALDRKRYGSLQELIAAVNKAFGG